MLTENSKKEISLKITNDLKDLPTIDIFNTKLSEVIDSTKLKVVGNANENDEYRLWKSRFIQNKNSEYEVGLWKDPAEQTCKIFTQELFEGIKKLN